MSLRELLNPTEIKQLQNSVCKNLHDINIFNAVLSLGDHIEEQKVIPKDEHPWITLQRKRMIEHIINTVGSLMAEYNVGLTKLIIIRWFYTQKLLDTTDNKDPLIPLSKAYNEGLWYELRKDGVSPDRSSNIENLLHQMIAFSNDFLDTNQNTDKQDDVIITFEEAMVIFNYKKSKVYISKDSYDKLIKDYFTTNKNEGFQTPLNRSNKDLKRSDRSLKKSQEIPSDELLKIRLFNLVCRYKALYAPGYHASIPEEVFTILRNKLKVSHELFASPFNHTLDKYFSAYPDTDGYFGSQGNFFREYPKLLEQGGSFEANPPFLEEHMTALALIIISYLRRDVPLSFVVIVPAWVDTILYYIFMSSKYNILPDGYLGLNRHEHYYRNGAYHFDPNEKLRKSNNKTLVFILQNEQGRIKYPVTEEMLVQIKESFCMTDNEL